MLMIINQNGEVLLEKRPPTGIWGGLWGFPEIQINDDLSEDRLSEKALQLTGINIREFEEWDSFRHTFSHYHLDITPVQTFADTTQLHSCQVQEGDHWHWFQPDTPSQLGLAAPVSRLLKKIKQSL